MKSKIISVMLVLIAVISLVGCNNRVEEENFQEVTIKQGRDKHGFPAVTNYTEMGHVKELIEKRDDADLICYAYTYSEMLGQFIYLGRCKGFGIPASIQYTNPDEVVGTNGATVSQADPNGLYTSDGLSGTWLWLLNDDGTSNIGSWEVDIIVVEDKLNKNIETKESIAGRDY